MVVEIRFVLVVEIRLVAVDVILVDQRFSAKVQDLGLGVGINEVLVILVGRDGRAFLFVVRQLIGFVGFAGRRCIIGGSNRVIGNCRRLVAVCLNDFGVERVWIRGRQVTVGFLIGGVIGLLVVERIQLLLIIVSLAHGSTVGLARRSFGLSSQLVKFGYQRLVGRQQHDLSLYLTLVQHVQRIAPAAHRQFGGYGWAQGT